MGPPTAEIEVDTIEGILGTINGVFPIVGIKNYKIKVTQVITKNPTAADGKPKTPDIFIVVDNNAPSRPSKSKRQQCNPMKSALLLYMVIFLSFFTSILMSFEVHNLISSIASPQDKVYCNEVLYYKNPSESIAAMDQSIDPPRQLTASYSEITIGNHSYLFPLEDKLTWLGAVSFCAASRMRLASVETKDKFTAIVKHISSSQILKTDQQFWLSGTNMGTRSGEFIWLTSGRNITNWNLEAPSFAGQCVAMTSDQLGVRNCTVPLQFICEKQRD